jgi:hypothetical protein
MDVLFFLKERTNFIRHFYKCAGEPFRETIRKIDAEEEPFEPPFSVDGGDGAPPFLTEWLEADSCLEALGRSCISMLSASLQLYLREWESELGLSCRRDHKKSFSNGFLQGYRTCFGDVLGIDWDDCPADFLILEQITLARNRAQHPDGITTLDVSHPLSDRRKFPRLFRGRIR